MSITLLDIAKFLAAWFWLAVLVGLCFGEWIRRHQP